MNPNFDKIFSREILKYPNLVDTRDIKIRDKNSLDLDLIKYDLANKIIVPSNYIYNEVVKKGIRRNKIEIVEHSLNDESWLSLKTNPKKGRVLFVENFNNLFSRLEIMVAEVCRGLINQKKDYEFLG